MSDAPPVDMTEQPAAPATPAKTRPFYWSVRRELWENRAVWMAPLAVGAVVLLGGLVSAVDLSDDLRAAAASGSEKAAERLMMPYVAIALTVLATSFLVSVFYSLGALQGERRDRSILFWKSLPVSDLTTVLAKAAIPVVVLPAIVLGVIFAGHVVVLAWSTLVIVANGLDPVALWSRLSLGFMWLVLGLALPILALWFAPIVAWLLLVSASARRMAILWAVAPPVALGVFERVALGTSHVFDLLDWRLTGGLAYAFSVGAKGEAPVGEPADLATGQFLASPDLWGGLIVAALLIVVTVRLRRSRDPI